MEKKKIFVVNPGSTSTKVAYFEDETCVFCKAKKNGGPGCELCEYAKDAEGNDIDNIICNYCPRGFLTTDGKCYNCKDELENGCNNCTLKVNDSNLIETLICTNCIDDKHYMLTNNNHCIHVDNFAQNIPLCSYQIN